MRVCRVFIHGSCVSRDTVAFAQRRFTVVHYQARQSVISVGSAADLTGLPEFRSPFQQRMFDDDLKGNALQSMRAMAPSIDIVLLDLCDERLGVQLLPDGSVMTRSVEGIAAGIVYPGAHIPFGSDAHFDLWISAFERYWAELKTMDLADRVMVLAVPWAGATTEGQATPSSFGVTAEAANKAYERYYNALMDLGVDVQRFGDALADPHHKWGAAPFHYESAVYSSVAERILSRFAILDAEAEAEAANPG